MDSIRIFVHPINTLWVGLLIILIDHVQGSYQDPFRHFAHWWIYYKYADFDSISGVVVNSVLIMLFLVGVFRAFKAFKKNKSIWTTSVLALSLLLSILIGRNFLMIAGRIQADIQAHQSRTADEIFIDCNAPPTMQLFNCR